MLGTSGRPSWEGRGAWELVFIVFLLCFALLHFRAAYCHDARLSFVVVRT